VLIDSRQLQNNSQIEADICIIGGGAAGVSLALLLASKNISVALLESGGLSFDAKTLDLYRGENVGLPYEFAGGHRTRYLGGSSNCWGGWCRPWTEHEFLRRSWVPDSDWPIRFKDVEPYYADALKLLKLKSSNFDTAYWERAVNRPTVRRFPTDETKVVDSMSQFSPPVRFGIDYRTELETSKLIRVYLWANVVNIDTDEHARTVTRLEVKTLSGRSMQMRGKRYVLATGGIENARLLLASNKVAPGGLGNGNDLVGRYFMDHPRLSSGSVKFKQPWHRNMLYDTKFHYQNDAVGVNGTRIAGAFVLTPEVQRDEQLLSSRAWFRSLFPGEGTEAVMALFRMKRRLSRMDEAGHTFGEDLLKIMGSPVKSGLFAAARVFHLTSLISEVKMEAIVEPEPNRDSRVMLSRERDALGMPRVKVCWKLTPMVKRTFDRTFQLLGESLIAKNVADVTFDRPFSEQEWPQTLEGTWHHMGTTRMHESPKMGVVDANCQVHDMSNLYVAGSSVFTTAASNFPTTTLVALAARLADHLSAQMKRPESEAGSELTHMVS
jgi:choline dehydrogenase-like flavoprotein